MLAFRRGQAQRLVEMYILLTSLAQILVLDITGLNKILSLGPVNVQVADITLPAIPLMIAFYVRDRLAPTVPVLILLGLYAFSLVRGIAADAPAALTDFRYDIHMLALLAIVTTGGVDRMGYRTVARILNLAALIVCAVSALRFAYGPNFMIDLSNVDVTTADDWNDGRTVSGPSIIILATAIIFNVCAKTRDGSHRLGIGPLSILFLVFVVISGQRTASIGLVLAIGLMLFNRVRAMLVVPMICAPIAIFLIVTGWLPIDTGAVENVGQDLGGRDGTFAFRTHIWGAFLDHFATWQPLNQLLGQPIGTPVEFYMLERVWTSSLHSAYLGLVPQIGIVGALIFFASLLPYIFRTIWDFVVGASYETSLSPELRVYAMLITLVYGISYEWRTIFGLLLGALLAPRLLPKRSVERD